MKAVNIDWVAGHRLSAVWLALGFAACIVLGTAAGYDVKLRRDTAAVDREIATLRLRLQQATAGEQERAAPNPRHASLAQAARLLSQDLNPVFTTVERVDIAGALLRSLSIDVKTGEVRAEYELDDFARVAEVDEAFNAGLTERPWKLERATVSASQSGMSAGVRAAWRVSLQALAP